MESQPVRVDRPAERVARITLDRPKVNALGRDLVAALQAAAETLAAAPPDAVSCVLIAAAGKAFCAGADLRERAALDEAGVREAVRAIGAAIDAVAAIGVPTIALVQGAALGGGFELALACDLRLAADDAPVGLPECSLAIIPGAGGTQRLARLVGPARAKRWIYTARVAAAHEALAEGLVDEVVSREALEARGLALAAEIARCGPVALRAAKRAIDGGLAAGSLGAGLAVERDAYAMVLGTADRREALAAFAAGRAPRFTGR